MTEIFHRIKRIVDWIPVLWKNREWDHSFLLQIMEFKLRRMANHFDKYGHHTNKDKNIKQMLEAAALCKRMGDENYFDMQYWSKIKLGKVNDMFYEDYMYKQDLDRLGLLFRKYLRTWWD